MPDLVDDQRRRLLQGAIVSGGLAAIGGLVSVDARAADKASINLQIGWLAGGNQIGEVCAKRLGYYEQEGLNLSIQPGGPNVDGVAVSASRCFQSRQGS